MKILHSIFIIILFLSIQSVLADESTDKIDWIKSEYKVIRNNLNNYEKIGYVFFGESSEGADAVGSVTATGEIKQIELTYYGEMGKSYYEFYYFAENIFFVFEKDYRYNTHIMITQETAEELPMQDSEMPEVFDSDKSVVKMWRYYFHKDNVLKIIGPEGTVISEPDLEKSCTGSGHCQLQKA